MSTSARLVTARTLWLQAAVCGAWCVAGRQSCWPRCCVLPGRSALRGETGRSCRVKLQAAVQRTAHEPDPEQSNCSLKARRADERLVHGALALPDGLCKCRFGSELPWKATRCGAPAPRPPRTAARVKYRSDRRVHNDGGASGGAGVPCDTDAMRCWARSAPGSAKPPQRSPQRAHRRPSAHLRERGWSPPCRRASPASISRTPLRTVALASEARSAYVNILEAVLDHRPSHSVRRACSCSRPGSLQRAWAELREQWTALSARPSAPRTMNTQTDYKGWSGAAASYNGFARPWPGLARSTLGAHHAWDESP